ncbi:hypothetical protein BU23DRAFT_559707 [Bimuria novae-zelandiae CBS 107.79]|uniref:Uncharacterized protein n=1 Tax=Bimuria novae-zelandiae CBS 107.79 TaxID=1447943 RepID=A0A6A5V147_9PLEO|nr:hypothetical protein BU23DRAFT_559707 [Bimuria novae-zelandiae CBS 107.79]
MHGVADKVSASDATPHPAVSTSCSTIAASLHHNTCVRSCVCAPAPGCTLHTSGAQSRGMLEFSGRRLPPLTGEGGARLRAGADRELWSTWGRGT